MDTSNDDSSLDLDISVGNGGSSTPMNSSFLSPLKKLDNLNLNNLSDISENDYDFDVGNKTIEESSEEEEHEQTDVLAKKPVYVNKRKRANVSDVEMVLTPVSNSVSSSYHSSNQDNGNNMSICSNITSTSLSNIKLSFSNSDSTPCPVPAKKRLRFDQNTPITKSKLLNFSHSVKTNINDLAYDLPHTDYHDMHIYEDNDHDDTPQKELQVQSTPISQSTPSNSRRSSPQRTPIKVVQEEPAPSNDPQQADIRTPVITPIFQSTHTINGYRLINKEVEPEVHIADQRIIEDASDDDAVDSSRILDDGDLGPRANDPYLKEPSTPNNVSVRLAYMNDKYKLPLLHDQNLDKHQLLQRITTANVLDFYTHILLTDEAMADLLKTERVKWHPDKWAADPRADMDIVNAVSQTINGIMDTMRQV